MPYRSRSRQVVDFVMRIDAKVNAMAAQLADRRVPKPARLAD
jgi:hypothetical protein